MSLYAAPGCIEDDPYPTWDEIVMRQMGAESEQARVCTPTIYDNFGVLNNPAPKGAIAAIGGILSGGFLAPLLAPIAGAIGGGASAAGSALASGVGAVGSAVGTGAVAVKQSGLLTGGTVGALTATNHDAFDWIQLISNQGLSIYGTLSQKPLIYPSADGPTAVNQTPTNSNLAAILKSPWAIAFGGLAFGLLLWLVWKR